MNMQTSTDRNLNFDFVRRQVEQPPAWASEVLQSWEEAYPQEKHAFLQSHYWTETGSINVFRVVGTDHWDYQGKSWLDFLTGGKRMQRNLQALLDNPSYYLQPTERRPAIHYNTLDGLSFYVGSDGNHRTCIARFFLAEQQKSQLHDVTLNHYQVNDSFYRLYGQLRQQILLQGLPVQIHPERAVGSGRYCWLEDGHLPDHIELAKPPEPGGEDSQRGPGRRVSRRTDNA